MGHLDFLVDTYETERLKILSVWDMFADEDLPFRPAPKARSVAEQFEHQLLSEAAWMQKMLDIETGDPLSADRTRRGYLLKYAGDSRRRLEALRARDDARWWEASVPFFDVRRSRAWILVRRMQHSTHHRGQLSIYLRLLGRPVYSIYGPTADTGGLPADGGKVIYHPVEI